MTASAPASLHVLGGGPAGLAAARRAHERGIAPRLHEAGSEAGGNCRTLRLGDCRFDTGAHRLHARDARDAAAFRALLGGALHRVDAPSRIVRDGRSFRFPPGPLDLARHLPPRLLARAAADLLSRPRRDAPADDFETLAVSRYGRTLADLFLLGYTRKLWGRDPSTLAPDVAGGRLEGLGIRGALRALLGPLAPFAGVPPHLDGAFLYPEGGIGDLTRALARDLPDGSVNLRSRVTRVRHDGRDLVSVVLNDADEEPVERVVGTLPLPLFLRALDPPPPPEVRAAADDAAFRNLLLCVFRIDADRVDAFGTNASLYFPDPDVPFTRAYEPKIRGPRMAPPGRTCLVVEIPCDPDDATWNAPDDRVLAHARAGLERTLPGFRDLAVLDAAVHRLPHAYPVLDRASAARAAVMRAHCARFSNLRLAGRGALFRYAHLHDMLRQGREAADALLDAPS